MPVRVSGQFGTFRGGLLPHVLPQLLECSITSAPRNEGGVGVDFVTRDPFRVKSAQEQIGFVVRIEVDDRHVEPSWGTEWART